MKYTVLMNGAPVVTFDSDTNKNAEKWARDYIDMQKRSMKGAGLAKTVADNVDAKKSFAAKQNWELRIKD
jgi:hypothetical protein